MASSLQDMLDRWDNEGRNWDSKAYYPAILDLKRRSCLVVGAGSVGEEKIKGLLTASATVKVVSKQTSDWVRELAERGEIDLKLSWYEESDIENCFLAIAATENKDTNKQVFDHAEKRGILCNVVDVPELCNFTLPSVHRIDDLIIAISTGGASPALARKLRLEISDTYGKEHADELKVLGALRNELKGRYPDARDRKIVFERIVYSDLLDLVRDGRTEEIDQWVSRCIEDGPKYASEADHLNIIHNTVNRESTETEQKA